MIGPKYEGTLTRIWARRGTRPLAPRHQRYNWAYLFGAACPGRGLSAAIVVPEADTAMMNLHLDAISKAVDPQAHGAVLLDGAGYHESQSLRVPSNITLLRLPRYAPERNSAEYIREYLRKTKFANTVFDSYGDIAGKACEAWLHFANDRTAVTTITAREWATVNSWGLSYKPVVRRIDAWR